MKKLNLAIIIMLLVFQTVLSPISVFAAELTSIETTDTVANPEESATPESEAPTPTIVGTSEGTVEEEDTGEQTPEQPNDSSLTDPETNGDGEATTEGEDTLTEGSKEESEELESLNEDAKVSEDPLKLDLLSEPVAPSVFDSSDVTMTFEKLTVGGQEITAGTNSVDYPNPKMGDTTSIEYKFQLGALSKSYGIGSTFTFDLPEHLLVFNESALSGSNTADGVDYTYETHGKAVTVTIQTELEEMTQYNIFFNFNAYFGNSADESKLEQNLEIPILGGANVTLPFIFKPTTSGQPLTKSSGTIERSADGTVHIPWTIWVNKGGETLANAQLEDTIGPGHVLDGKITVEQYQIGINGVNETNANSSIEENAFPITLPDTNNAYKIMYKTKVEREPSDETEEFENTATLTSTNLNPSPVPATQKVGYGTPLEKNLISSGYEDKDKYNAKWEIKYNYLGETISANQATLTDTITNKHRINYDTLGVYKITLGVDGKTETTKTRLTAGIHYDLNTSNDHDLEIDFSKSADSGNVKAAFKIEYETEAVDEFITTANQTTVKNEVTTGTGRKDDATVLLEPNIFQKRKGTIDYVNKTIIWTLTIKAEKDLVNFEVEDDFTTDNKPGKSLKHTLTTWSSSETDLYKVSSGVYTVTNPSNGLPAVGDEGFILKFTNTIPKGETITVQYKTKFEIEPNGGVANSYSNTAIAKWDGATSSNNTETKKDSYNPTTTSPTGNNGYKEVSVNHQTQDFVWKIGVNVNKQDIKNATLTDTLGAGHHIVIPAEATLKDQISIRKLTLNTEKGTPEAALDADKWDVETVNGDNTSVTAFKITFKNLTTTENNEAYLIEYVTKDTDEIFGQATGAKDTYTNSAILATPHNGSYPYTATATIKNANELIDKSAQINANDETITWTVTVNKSHSHLGNITLTDIPSVNQKILPHTFEKRAVKMPENGTIGWNSWESIDESAVVVNPDGSFSLDLGDLTQKGYQIRYKTFYLGGNGETVTNKASIGYAGATSAGTSDEKAGSAVFNFNSSATNVSATKGSFKLEKLKIDPITGTRETFEGIKFELWNKANTVKITEATSDENGIVTFENVRYGKYKVKEQTPTGYHPISDFEITMGDANNVLKPEAANVVLPIENVKIVDSGSMCPNFTLTIKDIDGELVVNKDITLQDEKGNVKFTGTTDNDGKVIIPREGSNSVQAGSYKVFDGTEELGKVTVKYGTNECHYELQPTNSCPQFTITLKDKDDNPRTNVAVTLKDKAGNVTISTTTDENGKFKVLPNTPSGKYDLYEGKQFLSEVVVSYKNGCETEVKQAPTCPVFTLTVNDVDGKPREGVTVTIKNVDTNTNITQTINPTDNEGKVGILNLEPGKYVVYDGAKEVGGFTVTIDCEATVQPVPACPQFTLTVKDENGHVRANVNNLTIKDKTGAIIVTNKTTNELGQINIPSTDIPSGEYNVYQGELFIGQITVQYSVNCEAEVVAAPTCPSFTLTVQTEFGTPLMNAKITIKDAASNSIKDVDNNEILTTSVAGTILLPNKAIKQGTYYVYEGSRLIGSFTVKDTCSALVKPTSTGGGGGGWTPDPEKPVDPSKPTPDPEKPVDPSKPTPDPENPVDPSKPTPDPEKPVDPGKPTPDPEKPVDPGKPTPDPEKPVDPGNPSTNPEESVDPENPTPDLGKPTTPGKPETSKPSVQDVIDQGENLTPYNPSTATKDTLDEYKDFLNKYNNLSKEEQAVVAQSLDIDKIKAAAKQLETQLNTKGKLPQTDGANQTVLTLIGLILVLGAVFFLRRRSADMK